LRYHDGYHFFNIYTNVGDCDMWIEALKAKYHGRGKFGRAEFDKLLGHCMAVTDAPCNAFAPELIDADPEAKVILVERDIEAWYTSFQNVLEPIYRSDFRVAAFLDPASSTPRRSRRGTERAQGVPGVLCGSEAGHAEGGLLEYKLESGWDPLCQILGKEVPDVPFPRINEAAALKSKM
ncbi:hypothetical protein B0H13DRAFT_1488298, partial [Mycena leptocephala]